MTSAQNIKYKVTIKEWDTHFMDGTRLTSEDRKLVENIESRGKGALSVDELLNGLRISTTSWIGVIRFSSFEVHILPKLANDYFGLVEMLDYTMGLNALRRYAAFRRLDTSGKNLLDLIALLFIESCEAMVRGGLYSDYITIEDDLPVIRGRLLAERQIRKRLGRVDRLECRYDEQITNIPENQIISIALQCCTKYVSDESTLIRLRRLHALFYSACNTDGLDYKQLRFAVSYNRLNEIYREPHELAWLLLDMMGVEDMYSRGRTTCFAFMLDMNQLFEHFIERWIDSLMYKAEFSVRSQHKNRSIIWSQTHNKPYTHVVPDLVVSYRGNASHSLAIDAKYKPYDDKKMSTADIFQTFLYAYAFSNPLMQPSALLLYPATTSSGLSTRLQVKKTAGVVGAHITAIGIPIRTVMDEIRGGNTIGAGTVSAKIRQVIIDNLKPRERIEKVSTSTAQG